jgi:hypothetical protein
MVVDPTRPKVGCAGLRVRVVGLSGVSWEDLGANGYIALQSGGTVSQHKRRCFGKEASGQALACDAAVHRIGCSHSRQAKIETIGATPAHDPVRRGQRCLRLARPGYIFQDQELG